MLGFTWAICAALAASTMSAAKFVGILERQELSPGSALYNCHNNCGTCHPTLLTWCATLLTLSIGQALLEAQICLHVCRNKIFLTNYATCQACAGPDNDNIWQYYGSDLAAYASSCGLSTSYLNGPQANATQAMEASNSTAACAAATVAVATPTASSTASATSAASTADTSSVSSTLQSR